MTLDEFRATARPVSDEVWAAILESTSDPAPRTSFTEYGGGYVLHEADRKFWPHAWWYKPVPYDTRAEAEKALFDWRAEFE